MTGMAWEGHALVPVSFGLDDEPDTAWWRCVRCEDDWPGLPERKCAGRRMEANDPRHGTLNGYQNRRCRCEACRRSWADYVRERRRKNHTRVTTSGNLTAQISGGGDRSSGPAPVTDTVRGCR